jgi:hypothetical protein
MELKEDSIIFPKETNLENGNKNKKSLHISKNARSAQYSILVKCYSRLTIKQD